MNRIAAIVLPALFITTSAALGEIRLQGAGATFPNPIYQRWVTEYEKMHPDIKIDYQSIGSGGGIKFLTDRTVDFAGSDAPMNRKEQEATAAPVLQIPSIAGGVAVAYNLPAFNGELKLTGPVVAEIFLGKIAKWNDAKIAAINPDTSLPDLAITPVFRTDGSGTNFVFTNYLGTQSDEFLENVGVGKQVKWPVGQGGKGSEGVTAVVQRTPGAIAYVEQSYATANRIPVVSIRNRSGKFVRPSPEAVSAAGEGALSKMRKTLAVSIWNQPGDNAYPISSFSYLIVYQDLNNLKSAERAKALVDFLKWATTDGQKMAASMDYAPLSEGVQKKVSEALSTLTFDGKAVAELK